MKTDYMKEKLSQTGAKIEINKENRWKELTIRSKGRKHSWKKMTRMKN